MQTLLTTEQALNRFSWYCTMRQERPVFFDEQSRVWHVFRYEDVARVLTDYSTFSKNIMNTMEARQAGSIMAGILRKDALSHRQLHNIVMQAFTPQVMVQLEPRISEVINARLDQVIVAGEVDVIKDLAYPLSIILIGQLLGVEQDENFKCWFDTLISQSFGDDVGEQRTAVLEEMMSLAPGMCQYFAQVLRERRQHPQDDLVSALLSAHINGQHLSESELLSIFMLLLASGTHSTTSLIGNAVLSFDEHPDIMDRLRAEPALMPTAIEEVLRYRSPVQGLSRITTREVMLGDQRIDAGQTIVAWIGSANHDEAQFSEPERFDIQRQPNRHLAFAHGIHFCVGAPLARLEAKILLTAMLQRLPGLRCKRDIPLDPIKSSGVFALKSLPITFHVPH